MEYFSISNAFLEIFMEFHQFLFYENYGESVDLEGHWGETLLKENPNGENAMCSVLP